MVKLTCSDVATCAGKLTLTIRSNARKRKVLNARTVSIGTANFSIAAGAAATVEVTLDKAGRVLLSAAHGHLNATLIILRTSPPANKTQSQQVRLKQGAARARQTLQRKHGPVPGLRPEARPGTE
ncbi:MAG TPA: hypothetical protein VK756_10330 [Solirubrobacteraceae bacterium]|nr:hypothetical protein [Solirubrobacteraceae bacterium]